MRCLRAYIRKLREINGGGSWLNVQIIIELEKPEIDILGLPDRREIALQTAIWNTASKKRLNSLIPDIVISDVCNVYDRVTNFGGYVLEGKYGFHITGYVNEFISDPEDDDSYIINEKNALNCNHQVRSTNNPYSEKIIEVQEVVEVQEGDINLSGQAKFLVACYIGRDLLWDGREYKFDILQYNEEQIKKEVSDLIQFQQSWVKSLCKLYGIEETHPMVGLVYSTMLLNEPVNHS